MGIGIYYIILIQGYIIILEKILLYSKNRINTTDNYWDIMLSKRGQISIDAVLAISFILLISAILSYNVFNTLINIRDAEIVERGYSIMDIFENYALVSYSKDVVISTTFEPIGDIGYTIRFSNKEIVVNNKTTVVFKREYNGTITYVNITGDNLGYVQETLPPNVVNISFGDFYITKNISVRIR